MLRMIAICPLFDTILKLSCQNQSSTNCLVTVLSRSSGNQFYC